MCGVDGSSKSSSTAAGGNGNCSVHEASTRWCAAVAFQLFQFRFKMVVVGEFFSLAKSVLRGDDDSWCSVNDLDLGIAVRLARVVDESRVITLHGSINDELFAETEHVTTDASCLVSLLALVSYAVSNHLSNILYQEFTFHGVFHDEQAASLDL